MRRGLRLQGSPDAEDWMYLVYVKDWTLNVMPLTVYP